jgi:hypothetical protein
MKLLFIFIHLFLFNQPAKIADSVNLRVYNNSKFFVKNYMIKINNVNYSFISIDPHSYSQYRRLPDVLSFNFVDMTAQIKRFLKHAYTIRTITEPIDNIGDKRIATGRAVLVLNIYMHHRNLEVEDSLKHE